MANSMVVVRGHLIKESPKAVYVGQKDMGFWIPKSQITHSLKLPQTYECTIPLWIAQKKEGMKYEEQD
jgi:hypothetical protein